MPPVLPGVESLGIYPWTSNEVAGIVVGALLMASALNANRIDSFVSRSQRRELGLCEGCGGSGTLPCRNCKGGTRKNRGRVASFLPSSRSTNDCPACSGKGRIPCQECNGRKGVVGEGGYDKSSQRKARMAEKRGLVAPGGKNSCARLNASRNVGCIATSLALTERAMVSGGMRKGSLNFGVKI